jgi:hypothetical protein
VLRGNPGAINERLAPEERIHFDPARADALKEDGGIDATGEDTER